MAAIFYMTQKTQKNIFSQDLKIETEIPGMLCDNLKYRYVTQKY